MPYPPLVVYSTEAEYQRHYEEIYCQTAISTFDGIQVRFRKRQFKHSFFESSKRDKSKDQFSTKRAQRLDWIKAALKDPNSERFVGWDGKRKRFDNRRRVAVVMGNYVVVIKLIAQDKADFVTAFVADTQAPPRQRSTLDKIRMSPKWTKINR